MKVLLVEDNVQIWTNIVRFLALNNITCDYSIEWKDWLFKSLNNFYDVIILDINLPYVSWIEILQKIREKWTWTQVLFLTSNSTKKDIIDGLNLWADDYITKPFDFDELLARINSLYRRNLNNKSSILKYWNYILDTNSMSFTKSWEEIKLSTQEFNLIKYFFQNKDKVISRKELYEKVWWEFDWDIMFSKTVDVYIWYLRKKIDKDIILTKKGSWYLLNT